MTTDTSSAVERVTDLLFRLYAQPKQAPFSNQGEIEYRKSLSREAADEIERLAAENEALREQAAQARKEALEEAYNALPDAGKDTDGIDAGEGYDEAVMDAKAAIRALAEKEGE